MLLLVACGTKTLARLALGPHLVTGKTFHAHPPGMGDPDTEGAPVFYVFKLERSGGQVSWRRTWSIRRSGSGGSSRWGDINGDGKVDIAVASKHGAFLFFQQ